jgi:putative molybdopterin biosynthesis protein
MVAGLHMPALRGAAPVFAKATKPLLKLGIDKLIGCSRRQQGQMLWREHARRIRSLPDPVRARMRLVNRQVGSGTRLLMDRLTQEPALDSRSVPRYADRVEQTHAADAASIANRVAVVGLGAEAAAIEFGLHFVPLVDKEYFLAYLMPSLVHSALQRWCSAPRSTAWNDMLAALPGNVPAPAPGRILSLTPALPWWRDTGARHGVAQSNHRVERRASEIG